MVAFKNLQHVTIIVSNLKRSKNFYEKVLGLKQIPRPDFPFPGVWYSLGKGLELHLIVGKRTHRWTKPKTAEIAYPHFAVQVSDSRKTYKQLKKTGYKFFDRISYTGIHQIFIMDPDHNMMEFIGLTSKTQMKPE